MYELKIRLGKLFEEQGLTNEVLELSQKVDKLIVEQQKRKLDKYYRDNNLKVFNEIYDQKICKRKVVRRNETIRIIGSFIFAIIVLIIYNRRIQQRQYMNNSCSSMSYV